MKTNCLTGQDWIDRVSLNTLILITFCMISYVQCIQIGCLCYDGVTYKLDRCCDIMRVTVHIIVARIVCVAMESIPHEWDY